MYASMRHAVVCTTSSVNTTAEEPPTIVNHVLVVETGKENMSEL
jgi:hypothetical protein